MPEIECFSSTLATCMCPSLLSAIFATHLPEGSPWCFTASLCFSSRMHVCSVFSCLDQPSIFFFPTTGGAKRALVKEGVQLDDFVLISLSTFRYLSSAVSFFCAWACQKKMPCNTYWRLNVHLAHIISICIFVFVLWLSVMGSSWYIFVSKGIYCCMDGLPFQE